MGFTKMDALALLGMAGLFSGVIVLSVFYYFQIPVLFGIIIGLLILVYVLFFMVRKTRQSLVDNILYYASLPYVTFILTVGVAITSAVLVPNEVVKRLIIAGIAVFACWLITFPRFIKQELGKQLHPAIDTGPGWSDPIYTGLGIVMFIGALIMQYFLVDLIYR